MQSLVIEPQVKEVKKKTFFIAESKIQFKLKKSNTKVHLDVRPDKRETVRGFENPSMIDQLVGHPVALPIYMFKAILFKTVHHIPNVRKRKTTIIRKEFPFRGGSMMKYMYIHEVYLHFSLESPIRTKVFLLSFPHLVFIFLLFGQFG